MIKIMNASQSLATLATDNTNGLGLVQPIEGTITEELNGIYELEFTVSADEKRFGELAVGGIVKLNAGETEGEQMFRIYEIGIPFNGIASVKACHISYDLNKIIVRPFTATGSVATKNGMMSNAVNLGPFTMTTDINNTASTFRLSIPRTFRECLGGYEGSLLDTFRGEYEFNNLNVAMLSRRGSDRGTRIMYGKNLTDFQQEKNNANVYTSVMGYAVVNDTTYTGNVYDKVTGVEQRIKLVDFSADYGEGEVPTTADLTAKAQTYANNNAIEVPDVNLSVSFVPLSKTQEYKNIAPLEMIGLGDTVYVDFSKMGVTASARVIRRVWDIVKERYNEIELGSVKSNLSSVINEAVAQVSEESGKAVSNVREEMGALSKLITNGLGLHFTAEPNGNGYTYYLHNGETLATSSTWYMMTANGLMVSTDYGQTWNAGFDSEGNAVLNSLATITLKALEIYGSSITFGDPDNKYITAQNYNQSGTQIGVSFDGTGTTRFQPQDRFEVNNLNAGGTLYNSMSLSYSEADDYAGEISLKNYSNGRLATEINMDADQYTSRIREYAYQWDDETREEVTRVSVSEEYYAEQKTIVYNNMDLANVLDLLATKSTGINTARMRSYRNGNNSTYADITETGSASPSVNISTMVNGSGSTLSVESGGVSIANASETLDLFDLLPKQYLLRANMSVTFTINSGAYSGAVIAQRYSASRTGALFIMEQYTANVTTIGTAGAVTVTRDSGRIFTIANSSASAIPLIGIGGHFS